MARNICMMGGRTIALIIFCFIFKIVVPQASNKWYLNAKFKSNGQTNATLCLQSHEPTHKLVIRFRYIVSNETYTDWRYLNAIIDLPTNNTNTTFQIDAFTSITNTSATLYTQWMNFKNKSRTKTSPYNTTYQWSVGEKMFSNLEWSFLAPPQTSCEELWRSIKENFTAVGQCPDCDGSAERERESTEDSDESLGTTEDISDSLATTDTNTETSSTVSQPVDLGETPTENAVDGDKNTDGGDVTPAWSYGSLFLWGVIALVVVTVVVAIIVRKRLSKNKKQAKGGDGSTAPPSNLNRHESINSLYYNPPQPISRHESINSLYYNPPQPISRHESINSLYYNPPQPISRHESINSLYYNPQQRDHEGDCSPSGPGAAEGASSHTYATLDEYELGYVMPNVTANEDM